MKTGHIKIEYREHEKPNVEVQTGNGTVWMTTNEIARLFDVFTSAINSNLQAMFKKGILRESEVCCTCSLKRLYKIE